MIPFIVRRLLSIGPVLVVVSLITFGLMHLTPGDPAVALAGEFATPERVELIRERYGFNDPFYMQYGTWVVQAVQGQLGTSLFSSLPVTTAIFERVPVTIGLTVAAIIFSLIVGIPLGIIAGLKSDTLVDRFVTVIATFGISMPHFWLGTLLILAFALANPWMPVTGYIPFSENPAQWLRHITLPAIALGAATSAELARQMRSSVRDVKVQDYIRTADAMGLAPTRIVSRHILKNAAIPVVTVLGLQVVRLISGAVVIEQVFALPGVGNLAINAVLQRDIPLIQGLTLFIALLVIAISFMVDLSYGYLNPKVRQT